MVRHTMPSHNNTMAATTTMTPSDLAQYGSMMQAADTCHQSGGVQSNPLLSPPHMTHLLNHHHHHPTSSSFTEQEDEFLKELVKRYGTRRWHIIAAKMQNKTSQECRKRWQTYLHMCMNKSSWSADEDGILLEGHSTFGNRWTEIAKLLPGRTDNAVKNRYNALCKKRSLKPKSMETELNAPDNIQIVKFTSDNEFKISKRCPDWRQERGDSYNCSLCNFIHWEIHVLPQRGDYVCLEPKRQCISSYLPHVSSCASPKEAQTDMEEVMGWLTARTPTPECEEKDRSNSILSSSSLAQKHRVMSAESRKL